MHAKRLRRILTVLDQATEASELTDPAFRAHALKGDRIAFWSMWVNGNWRVTFRFLGTDVELVDYEDYH